MLAKILFALFDKCGVENGLKTPQDNITIPLHKITIPLLTHPKQNSRRKYLKLQEISMVPETHELYDPLRNAASYSYI